MSGVMEPALLTTEYMVKNFIFIPALLICSQSVFSQRILKGRVMSEETKKPIPSVSVFLDNTSIGAVTNEQGLFTLNPVPAEKFRLVATSVGYETFDSLVNPRLLPKEFIILLKTKPEELQAFEVVPPDPDGWKKWGKVFTDIFIGTTPRSHDCKLVNPEVIKFRLHADNTLTAYSKEPLEIMNYDLGYEIKYRLEEFDYNFNTRLVNYSGYAFFKDLALSHPKRARKYEEERLETYTGSLLHFMRAFYLNKLDDEGFEMRSLGNISNPEKDRAKKMFSLHKDSVILDTTSNAVYIPQPAIGSSTPPYIETSTVMTVDSTDYFRKMLLQPDSVISHQPVSGDSIGFAADSLIAGLYFPDSLEVSYKLKGIPNGYRALSKEHKQETHPVSQFVFVHKRPVYVLSNGYHYNPYDLKVTGYWAWWENISTLLPFDYLPAKR